MAFYHPRCIDASGGFYHYFKDDGTVYDSASRHLVSSTRFVFNYAMAYRHFNRAEYLQQVRHGVDFLRTVHRNPSTGAYAWQLRWENGQRQVTDANNHCYGLAFVVFGLRSRFDGGVSETKDYLYETIHLMEEKFWQAEYGLYADQASEDWSMLDPYRGQNANMHSCGHDCRLPKRPVTRHSYIAPKNCAQLPCAKLRKLMEKSGNTTIANGTSIGTITSTIKPTYSVRGFSAGHFTEWSKLLMLLDGYAEHLQGDAAWLLPTAEKLFATAMETSWDAQHGGICYGFAPITAYAMVINTFGYKAESFAAAACLAKRTGKESYWQWYDKIWHYSWQHMVDHQHGAWYRILRQDNSKISDEKSPAGKTDYHTMGACYEVLNVLGSICYGAETRYA